MRLSLAHVSARTRKTNVVQPMAEEGAGKLMEHSSFDVSNLGGFGKERARKGWMRKK